MPNGNQGAAAARRLFRARAVLSLARPGQMLDGLALAETAPLVRGDLTKFFSCQQQADMNVPL